MRRLLVRASKGFNESSLSLGCGNETAAPNIKCRVEGATPYAQSFAL